MPNYKTRGQFQNSLWENLGNSAGQSLGMVVDKQQKDKELKQAIEKIFLEASLKDMRLKPGANLSGIDTSKGMGGMLGQVPGMFERAPVIPQTSISISERPYTEMQKAREVLQRSPADYGKAGMAQKVGGNILGIPTGWGFGSKWQVSPEAQAEQAGAQSILGNPYKTTKRISYKGDTIDTTGTDVTAELPDPSGYEEGTVIEDDSGQRHVLQSGQWIAQ